MSIYGYRNVWYNQRTKHIHLWTWNENKERVEYREPFNPYLFVESNTSNDAISIFETPLRKIVFTNQFDRKRYLTDSGIKRIFYNIKCEQQFLIDKFLYLSDKKEYGSLPLKISTVDVEVHSPYEFPKAEEARHPINLLTVHDSITNIYHTFGTSDSKKTRKNVIYYYCKTEADLLEKFINFWQNDYCDIVTGWNIFGFDIPYIINRITNILGPEYVNKLSPVGSLYYKEDTHQQYGKTMGRWVIHGINCVDYKEVYETFSREKRESYSLDHISKVELGEGKVQINATNLAKLSETDWDQFVDYNIQDVCLVVKLEDVLRFLKTMRLISYKGYTNIEATMGKVSVITGAVAAQALKRNRIISTFTPDNIRDYAGGFVKEIDPGLRESIVTFDANSLYPNTLITLNISPETKIGKIISIDETNDKIEILLVNGKIHNLTRENFYKFLEKEKIAISKAKILFTQSRKGIIPEYIDALYEERVKIKKEMFEVERSLVHCKEGSDKYKQNKLHKEQLDLLQFTIKILLNSTYGVFANRFSPLADIDLASSITLTGQSVIKQSSDIVDKYLKEKYNIATTSPITFYNDTDSVVSDTLIRTDKGIIRIDDLFTTIKNKSHKVEYTKLGHEVIIPTELYECLSFDINNTIVKYKPIKCITKHKTNKKLFKITLKNGKQVIVTEDHNCMIYKDDKLQQVTPKSLTGVEKMVVAV